MKIFIGADHRGVKLKRNVVEFLEKSGHTVVDVGAHKDGVMCDYPNLSEKVAVEVVKDRKCRGILLCMSGIGHSIAANKFPGVYAALCCDKQAAKLSRQHNNSNILILGAKFVSENSMKEIIKIWLKENFQKGRHLRRINQIKRIEKRNFK